MALNRSELMLRLTRTLARLPPQKPLPLRMCQAFVSIVEARAGSITLGFATNERTVLCATDEAAARYEDAQDFTREGPSLDAFRTADIVFSESLDDHRRRWPGLATSFGQPLTQVRAIPIHPDTAVMGVLTVHDGYRMHSEEGELRFLADAIGAAIIGELPSHDDESRLWSERDQVSQATGMVVAQLQVGAADALALLRAHAFAHDTTVTGVSRRVVERQLDFSRPDRGEMP